jgi:hypothetical protein
LRPRRLRPRRGCLSANFTRSEISQRLAITPGAPQIQGRPRKRFNNPGIRAGELGSGAERRMKWRPGRGGWNFEWRQIFGCRLAGYPARQNPQRRPLRNIEIDSATSNISGLGLRSSASSNNPAANAPSRAIRPSARWCRFLLRWSSVLACIERRRPCRGIQQPRAALREYCWICG